MRAVIKSLSWSSVSCAVIPASMAFLHVLCSLPFLKPLLGPPCSAQQISLEITLWSPWLVLFSTTAPAPAASCANAAKPLSKLLWSGSSTIVLQLPQKLNKKPTHRLVSIDSAEVITTDAGRRMTYTSINMRQISWRHCYYSGLTESTDPSLVLFQQRVHSSRSPPGSAPTHPFTRNMCSGGVPLPHIHPVDPPAAQDSSQDPWDPRAAWTVACLPASLQACLRALGDQGFRAASQLQKQQATSSILCQAILFFNKVFFFLIIGCCRTISWVASLQRHWEIFQTSNLCKSLRINAASCTVPWGPGLPSIWVISSFVRDVLSLLPFLFQLKITVT